MKEDNENNLYARWLNGDLSKEEIERIKATGEEKELLAIINEVDDWTLPDLKESSYTKVLSKATEVRIVPLYRKPMFMAAASVVILVGFFTWLFFANTNQPKLMAYSSKAGEVKEIVLPDQTTVTLFGNSSIKIDSEEFIKSRKVNLTGEAYFSVVKKGDFEVNFKGGSVHVLGTKFNVLAGNDISSIRCYEGKVEVSNGREKAVLIKGEGSRYNQESKIEKYSIDTIDGSGISAMKQFENSPLSEVFNSITLYYDVEFKTDGIDLKRNYTGRYSLTSLDTALKLVFDPMKISYEKEGRIIVLKNN